MIYSILCAILMWSLCFFNLEGLFVLFKRFLPVLDVKELSLSCKCRLMVAYKYRIFEHFFWGSWILFNQRFTLSSNESNIGQIKSHGWMTVFLINIKVLMKTTKQKIWKLFAFKCDSSKHFDYYNILWIINLSLFWHIFVRITTIFLQ